MKERPDKESPVSGYLAGIATEIALTLVMFGAAFIIIFVLEWLVK